MLLLLLLLLLLCVWGVSGFCFGFPVQQSFAAPSSVSSVAWSPSSAYLVSASAQLNVAANISIWDVSSGLCLKNLTGHSNAVESVAWSPNGAQLASGSIDKMIKIWDVSTGLCLKTLIGHSSTVQSVAWSPDGAQLASGSADTLVKIWDVSTGLCLKNLTGHYNYVWSVGWSPSGTQLASGSIDKMIKIWDVSTGLCLKNLTGHSDYVYSVSWSPSGTQLASGSADNLIKIWDVSSGLCLKTLTGHSSHVWSVSWSPSGTQLASGSQDTLIKIWDVLTGLCLRTLPGHSYTVDSVAWNPSGTQLASGSIDNLIKVWDTVTSLKTLTGHSNAVESVAWSPSGTQLASGSLDKMIKIWDVSTGLCLKNLTGHLSYVVSVAWSPSGTQLASGSADSLITIWDVSTGLYLKNLTGHSYTVQSVAWSSNSTQLVSGSIDKLIKIWDVSSGLCLKNLTGHSDSVESVAWSPSGTLLASGSLDTLVKIWDVSTGLCLKTLVGHSYAVYSVAWSPNSAQLVSGSQDTLVKIWDVSTGLCLKTLTGHSNYVWAVGWSPSGTQLASGSIDKMIKIWDVSTGLCLKTLTGHSESVESVAWSPSGTQLASGSADNLIKVWFTRTLKLTFNNSVTPLLDITGTNLGQNLLIQLLRADNDGTWLDCVQLPMIGSNSHVSALASGLRPGTYGVGYYNDESSNADTPWTNFTAQLTVLCPVGTEVFLLGESNASCIRCPSGKYSPSETLSPCVHCEGIVKDNFTGCQCYDNATLTDNRCVCNYKFYPLNSSYCQECPSQVAICNGTSVIAADGFWQVGNQTLFLPCANQEACVGGKCLLGYEGKLCGECVAGYAQSQRLCKECSDNFWALAALKFLGSIVLSIGLLCYFVYKALGPQSQAQLPAKMTKVAYSAAQVNAMLGGLGVRFPIVVEILTTIQQSASNPTTVSTSCIYLQMGLAREHVFYATSLMWLLSGPLLILTSLIVSLVLRKCGKELKLRKLLVATISNFIFTSHTSITLQALQMFVCRAVDFDDIEKKRLSADIVVQCFNSLHLVFMFTVGVLLLLLYVLAPPVVAWLYLRNLKDSSANEIQFLCSEFKPNMNGWFLVVLVRKALIAFFLASSVLETDLQAFAIVIVLVIFFGLQLSYTPYSSSLEALNTAEAMFLFSSMSIFLIVAVFYDNPNQAAVEHGAGIAILSILVGSYSFVGALMVQDMWRKRLSKLSKFAKPLLLRNSVDDDEE